MTNTKPNDRAALIRRSLILQLKLLVDGLRDFLLVPVALIATLIGLLRRDGNYDQEFNQVIELGRSTERWIDLFGSHKDESGSAPGVASEDADTTPDSFDAWAARAEALVQKEIRDGQMTEQAAKGLRETLSKLKPRRAP